MKFGLIELATVRFKLRELNADDEEALFDIYSDKEVMKYWDSPPITTFSQAGEMISDAKKWWDAGDSICLAIEESNSNLVIGTISLFNFHQESKRAEIGYILGRSYWGYGFMTEVLIKIIDYSFFELDLNRLEADIDPDNSASAKLLKKLGFSLEGRLKQRWIVNGNVSDSEIYGLVRGDLNNNKTLKSQPSAAGTPQSDA